MPKRARSAKLIHPSQDWERLVPVSRPREPVIHRGITRRPDVARPPGKPLSELHLKVLALLGPEPRGPAPMAREIGSTPSAVTTALFVLALRELARIVPGKGWVATGKQP